MANPKKPSPLSDEQAEVVRIVRQADAGNKDALAKLRTLFDKNPKSYEAFGNSARHAEQSIIKLVSGGSPVVEAATERKLEELEAQLAGPNPTPLEKLLAERVALCWVQANYADAIYAQTCGKSHGLKEGEYLQRRQDRSHARFLSAVKTLALVRRLAVPPLRAAVTNEQANRAEFLELSDEPQAVRAAAEVGETG